MYRFVQQSGKPSVIIELARDCVKLQRIWSDLVFYNRAEATTGTIPTGVAASHDSM
jgi:hypothetical protein